MQKDLIQVCCQTTGIATKQSRFMKLFLADLAYFYELPRWANEILYELLMRTDEKGEIIINMGIKKRIAAELGISVASIKNALCIYSKKHMLIRQEEGIYLANPLVFGKGQWQEIKGMSLEVSYTSDGTRQIEVRIEKVNQKEE